MVSLGSTGIVNQMMSGLTITYSRALRLGDFVKVGDVEGTVTHLGPLADEDQDAAGRGNHDPERGRRLSRRRPNYSRIAERTGCSSPTS